MDLPQKGSGDETIGKIMHPRKTNVWICPICKSEFNANRLLVNHLKSKHGINKVTYTCNLCGKVEKECRQIGMHLRYCVGSKNQPEKEYKCLNCNHSFDTKSGLGVHRQSAHKTEYNETLKTKRVFAWEEKELQALAEKELELKRNDVSYINISLQASFQHRKVENIAKIRQGERYKAILPSVKTEYEQQLQGVITRLIGQNIRLLF